MLLGLPLGHIVAVAAPVLFGGMKRGQGTTVVAEHKALKQLRHSPPRVVVAHPAVGRQDGMDLVPQGLID